MNIWFLKNLLNKNHVDSMGSKRIYNQMTLHHIKKIKKMKL